jgi:transposase InsO family protein
MLRTVFEYIVVNYNCIRCHSSNGNASPEFFEATFAA